MSAHEQAKMISTHVHTMFGYALMGGALARIIEICFVDGRPAATSGWADAWRMLMPFVSQLHSFLFSRSDRTLGPHFGRVRKLLVGDEELLLTIGLQGSLYERHGRRA